MSIRDSNGRFIKRNGQSIEEKIKTMYSLQESWKNRPNYIGDIKDECPRIYGIWRGLMFTKKGKDIGISEDWRNFRNFYNDVRPTYVKGRLFRRLDSSKPYTRDNFIWVTQEESNLLKSNLVTLTYHGKTLSLRDWANELNESFYAIKNRYYRRDKFNYTIEEILLGRKVKRGTKIVRDNIPNLRAKVSKMISSYKHSDKVNNLELCDIDIDWMIENIISKPCIYCGDTHRVGCDRIDNSRGHTKDNVVPCCYDCNCARNNNFSVEEMKIIGKAIKEVKEKRKITIV